ncbi:carboxypeptidase-like regulatory domain-containing protein [Fibrella sp. WM1]|uniref:carboxypeptidase-like regulatory domain-containing protein n=1 Tax=Fibrella musci TaxID=3242485 RepID=UPI0035220492
MNRSQTLRLLTGSLLLLSGLSLTACKKNTIDPTEPTDPINGPGGKAGYLVGKVTDPQGKALPRATVYTDNTVFRGRGAEVKTGNDGTYQIQLVQDLGQWVAKGYILKQYNDRTYKINLDPENPDSFTDSEKPVRNFQWKLTGHIPDQSLDLYYGGTLEMSRDPNMDLYDNENVEFTLTPVGPLIDGSTGKTLTLRAKRRYDTFLKDIPMGRYKITAVYKPTGQALRVCDYYNDSDYAYASSVTVDFTGTESANRGNMMGISYTNR